MSEKITRNYQIWCYVKACDNGCRTSQVAQAIGIDPKIASRHLMYLYDCGFLKRERLDEGRIRFKYLAAENSPQPYHGGHNSLANKRERKTVEPAKTKRSGLSWLGVQL